MDAADTAEKGITFLQAWGFGGTLMWVLLAMSIVAFALAVYLAIAHRREALAPSTVRSDVLDAIRRGDLIEARRLCERRPCPFADVALAGVSAAVTPTAASRVRDLMEAAGAHVAGRLNAAAEYLLDIATIAPLVGLLGTVLGMFTAFGAVANDVASAKPVVLAQGVSQAIVTTVFGLAVSIPALVAYAYFRRRVARRVDELEDAAAEVADAIATVAAGGALGR